MEKTDIDALLFKVIEKRERIAFMESELTDLENEVLLCMPTDGSNILFGQILKVKVTIPQNVSYSDKDKLAQLVAENKDVLSPLFRIEVKESGSKVEKFLALAEGSVAVDLKSIRVIRAGKPKLEIEPQVGG